MKRKSFIPTPESPTRKAKNHRREHVVWGFTLVELLLYLALSAMIILMVSSFLTLVLKSRVKGQVISEVEGQGMQAMQTITQEIRNASSPSVPIGGSGSTLSLAPSNVAFNQTGDALYITIAGAPVALTSAKVRVSNLSFQNVGSTIENTTDPAHSIRIKFTLSYVNLSGRNEYEYSRNFTGSATIRRLQ